MAPLPYIIDQCMPWQDAVLAFGSLIFAVALIPSLRSDNKPALFTNVCYAIVLMAFTAVYASLEYWLTAAIALLTTIEWTTLALQTIPIRKSRFYS